MRSAEVDEQVFRVDTAVKISAEIAKYCRALKIT